MLGLGSRFRAWIFGPLRYIQQNVMLTIHGGATWHEQGFMSVGFWDLRGSAGCSK